MRRLIIGMLMILMLGAAAQTNAGSSKIKLLFLVGGGTHAYKEMYPVLQQLLERTGDFQITVTEDRSNLTDPVIKQYDLVLLATHAGTATPEQETGLRSFIAGGKGLVGIHTATATYKKSDPYWQLIGGRFNGHAPGTPKFDVKIEDPKHPIMRGTKDFQIADETYRHLLREDAPIRVLARRPADNEPVMWTRDFGKGRVFINALGHSRKSWEDPNFQRVTLRAIYWAAGRKPKDPPTK